MKKASGKISLENNGKATRSKSEKSSTPPNSPQVSMMMSEMRPILTPRRKKGVEDYALEYKEDLVVRCDSRDGKKVQTLVCRFCSHSVTARSDRIKEHLNGKKHLNLKSSAAANITQNEGHEFLINHSVESEGGELGMSSEPVSPNTPKVDVNNVRPKIQVKSSGSVGIKIKTGKAKALPGNKEEMNPKPSNKEIIVRVRWNNYETKQLEMYAKYQEEGHFTDVILSCEGKNFKCHKLILAACSSYFEDVFLRRSGSQSPIFFFNDIHKREMTALVEFMYAGKVTLEEGHIEAFVKAAKALQIKGFRG